jgi:hypothetical protein
MQMISPSSGQWRDDAKYAVGVAGDGALLFLSSVKESTDVFPPLKSAAASILVFVDLISVRLIITSLGHWSHLA